MNAMTIADLSLSQDLDRKALAAVIGGTNVCAITLDHVEYVNGPWSNYYDPNQSWRTSTTTGRAISRRFAGRVSARSTSTATGTTTT